ncbi:hypothetical protein CHRY9390_00403 [Chryseobacterium aquaeductus]|uniref:Uncharacterized protein n=1 Tax=Chryseobacterium aquaeductus TaxID=2675056 RepID=A0A9N8ME05_9FLAO|nr:hypothetical protein [Chryseobacterium aquaeductus]CAA7329760.1 hypothetical protein CHRY9390_00403 [Chryseobacterium potabilaquae]CAD7798890.1 hypothetical protein CHRY9390_00403 [Chryseobacterium aquaeductus]
MTFKTYNFGNLPYLKPTQNELFFGSIPIVLNEKTTFDACYQKVLELLGQKNVTHKMPNNLLWDFDVEQPESFVKLNHYRIQLTQNKDFEICGEVLQHEPYQREDYVIGNFLSIEFNSDAKENFKFLFVHFDGDLQPKNLKYDLGYYQIQVPEKFQIIFENAINGM